jgi:alkanesulfonate monooxygenase SsuD/methylene tetrahydromethanopterin reductase-like flavin-dependent oxidoreductase (luciferase family)
MQRAALLGDGWFPYLYSPRRYTESVATIRRLAKDAGRDLTHFQCYVFVFLNIDPDGDLAREAAARMMGSTYRQDFQAMIDSVAAAGTANEVTAKLRRFFDAGARHFVFLVASASADQGRVLDRLCVEVIPALREQTTPSQPHQ